MRKRIIFSLFLLAGLVIYKYPSFSSFKIVITTVILIEIFSFTVVKLLNRRSQLIITSADKNPELSWDGLLKFFKSGYDQELGWIRKPNTRKEEKGKNGAATYNIDKYGARKNPEHEDWPTDISCYGDSFTFARQIDDNQTWEWFLSEYSKTNVVNFGVGNYGIDQALLRLKREFPKKRTRIVIMGIVPSTIIRILSVWKHYHDYGNTFGFKPVFVINNGRLKLIPNPLDSEDKFFRYDEYLKDIQKYDYFYKNKFKREMLRFPYSIAIISNPLYHFGTLLIAALSPPTRREKEKTRRRQDAKAGVILNFLRSINLRMNGVPSADLFKKKNPVELLTGIIHEFIDYAAEENFTPVLLIMPQKEDIVSMQYHSSYYKDFAEKISSKIYTIDLTGMISSFKNLDEMYTDDSKYGGHFSSKGNEAAAKEIYERLKQWNLLSK